MAADLKIHLDRLPESSLDKDIAGLISGNKSAHEQTQVNIEVSILLYFWSLIMVGQKNVLVSSLAHSLSLPEFTVDKHIMSLKNRGINIFVEKVYTTAV
jgi:hypothetical protein